MIQFTFSSSYVIFIGIYFTTQTNFTSTGYKKVIVLELFYSVFLYKKNQA